MRRKLVMITPVRLAERADVGAASHGADVVGLEPDHHDIAVLEHACDIVGVVPRTSEFEINGVVKTGIDVGGTNLARAFLRTPVVPGAIVGATLTASTPVVVVVNIDPVVVVRGFCAFPVVLWTDEQRARWRRSQGRRPPSASHRTRVARQRRGTRRTRRRRHTRRSSPRGADDPSAGDRPPCIRTLCDHVGDKNHGAELICPLAEAT